MRLTRVNLNGRNASTGENNKFRLLTQKIRGDL
jgi:hypothetical protein